MKNPFGKKTRTPEELDHSELYKDKLFYEVVYIRPGEFRVYGPVPNLYYSRDIKEDTKFNGYVQVISGKIVASFNMDEILVTKTALVGLLRENTNPKGELNENR